MSRIESLLSARLFLAPQSLGDRLFFISNLGGHLSLYAMDRGGSVPEPLLPPHIALQNPHLLDSYPFCILPQMEKILVMIDNDGDEKYQPMLIPLQGGFPEPAFGDSLAQYQVICMHCDPKRNIAYLNAASHDQPLRTIYQAHLETGELIKLGESSLSLWVSDASQDHTRAIVFDHYTMGDTVLHLWSQGNDESQLLYGTPLEQRKEGETPPLSSISYCHFTSEDQGLICITALFSDTYGLGFLRLDRPQEMRPVTVSGSIHQGQGELDGLKHLKDNRYLVEYNIDGCSWLYEGSFDEQTLHMRLEHVICGTGELSNGTLESVHYDKTNDRYVLSFSTATSPTQIYTVEQQGKHVIAHTRERVLGLPSQWLSPGEDAAFTSFDGLRISARLYLPADELGFEGPRPLVYYIHGGPQSQERPDFAWFSMPLIQYLTLNGFAVFVPNVRGSTGYGLSYMKQVDRDWGGKDRLDHVHAMQILAQDERIDTTRAAVIGRSYGGYMTLTLASRHPELWSAAVDMFGPYDLFTFMERIPESWKPYFALALGDPVKDRDFLMERSPRTYIEQITCPLLVIQGRNDPRVVEPESRDVVEQLQRRGKQVEYLVFDNEGHDILKFENRVQCYNTITEFFKRHLRP